jgi:uncharacterized protein (TIGR02996 family)
MTTPLDLLALLAAYKVNPDDPVRMLVLADWLEENGGPLLAARGEFVRLQSRSQRAIGNKERQDELLRQHGAQWLGPLLAVAETYVWHHGLLHLGVKASALASPAAERLTADDFAWVEGVTVSGVSPEGAAHLAVLPWLLALTTLELRGSVGDEGATALAASPHVRNLRTLLLGSTGIGDVGVTALARSPTLIHLSVLSLALNQFRDEGAQALAASPHLAHLRQLNLAGNRIGHRGLPALRAAARANPRLWIHVGGHTQL